jgi:hypothetical protein
MKIKLLRISLRTKSEHHVLELKTGSLKTERERLSNPLMERLHGSRLAFTHFIKRSTAQ